MAVRQIIVASALIGIFGMTSAPAADEGQSTLDNLAWLVGGKWVAKIKSPDGGALVVEAQFEWAGHKKAIKYEIVFRGKEKPVTQYEGIYWWHPGKKQLARLQIDRAGNVTESLAAFDGDKMKQENIQSRADGKKQEQRVELTRDGDDAFVFKAFVQKDGNWVEAAAFKYTRERDK
jgi:hypothetical protein